MLGSMGFTPADAALPVSAFSGGWKMRIGLGKILLQEPQVRPPRVAAAQPPRNRPAWPPRNRLVWPAALRNHPCGTRPCSPRATATCNRRVSPPRLNLQVLLLDEPTNHMDLESVEWLERYLVEQVLCNGM